MINSQTYDAAPIPACGSAPQERTSAGRSAKATPGRDIGPAPETTPEELAELCEYLLERGDFRSGQWGTSDIVKAGRLPVDIVPRHWSQSGPGRHKELCLAAEMQLEEYGDEALHRFLVNVASATRRRSSRNRRGRRSTAGTAVRDRAAWARCRSTRSR